MTQLAYCDLDFLEKTDPSTLPGLEGCFDGTPHPTQEGEEPCEDDMCVFETPEHHWFHPLEPTSVQAFVRYECSTDTIYVAFRGTQMTHIREWLADAHAAHVSPIPPFTVWGTSKVSRDCKDAKVHEGVNNALNSLLEVKGAPCGNAGLHNYVSELQREHPCAKIKVSGHSLGGGLATLYTAMLLGMGWDNCISLNTFGSLRVGDPIFAKCFHDAWDQACCTSGARVVHNQDPVPHLPLRVMPLGVPFSTDIFWDHVGGPKVVWLPEHGGSPRLCCVNPEDICCMGEYSAHDEVHDHTTYFPTFPWEHICEKPQEVPGG